MPTPSSKKCYYLDAMGIQVWQPRAEIFGEGTVEAPSESPLEPPIDAVPEPAPEHSPEPNAVVLAAGNPDADCWFVGYSPAGEDSADGTPFSGRPGRLLDAMLRSVGLERAGVYLIQFLDCRAYFDTQIGQLKPRVIVILGQEAAAAISAGQECADSYQGVPLVISSSLEQLIGAPGLKRAAWLDLLNARRIASQ